MPDNIQSFVGDLYTVEQKLIAYVPGELAYVENVLRGETRDRDHRVLHRLTTENEFETEDETETQNELEKTDRFELRDETSKQLNSKTELNIGVDVSASLGPVKIGSSFGYGSSSSENSTETTAATFGKETVERSIERVQSRVRELRRESSLTEVEESNHHGFENTSGENIVGFYQWLDKTYDVGVFRTGKRLFLECMIPEPSLSYRYAHADQQAGLAPEPPLPLDVPLEEIENHYLRFAAEYGVALDPPPPVAQIVTHTFESEAGTSLDGGRHESAALTLEAAGGYDFAYGSAQVNWIEALPKSDHPVPKDSTSTGVRIHIADVEKHFTVLGSTDKQPNSKQLQLTPVAVVSSTGTVISSTPPPTNYTNYSPTFWPLAAYQNAVPVSINSRFLYPYSVSVTLRFVRSEDLMNQWRIETFQALSEAYQRLQADYAAKQLLGNALGASNGVPYVRPERYRSIERTELKRGFIYLMRQDFFGGVLNVLPDGHLFLPYPHNIPTYGAEVRFFEEAIDWDEMVYRFFPYYWANGNKWIDMMKLDSGDPIHNAFLQAGYGRVIVPVNPAFETEVGVFLETGVIPQGDVELGTEYLDMLLGDLAKSVEGDLVGPRFEATVPTELVMLNTTAPTTGVTLPSFTGEPGVAPSDGPED